MKCEVCLEHLEQYLDGELPAEEQEQINAHLITCADCAASFSALTAEQELFNRYDRELEVPPFLWTRIAQETVAGNNSMRAGWRARLIGLVARPASVAAVAMLLLGIAVGVVYLNTNATLPRNGTDLTQAGPMASTADSNQATPKAATTDPNAGQDRLGSVPQRGSVGLMSPQRDMIKNRQKPEPLVAAARVQRKIKPATRVTLDQSDVLSSDLGYLDIDDRDTAKHIEQTQLLLRSIRNVPMSDSDEEIDVSYDKALSRRLLNENVVLRRDAEMKAKFPTKTLLADLEPFLIDIANLPDHARPEEVRAIKDRVQKTEIVAALMGYQDRSPNNR